MVPSATVGLLWGGAVAEMQGLIKGAVTMHGQVFHLHPCTFSYGRGATLTLLMDCFQGLLLISHAAGPLDAGWPLPRLWETCAQAMSQP